MEESSEKRRERLRAMREEAALAGGQQEEEQGGDVPPSLAKPPNRPGFPLLSDLQQAPLSPSPRFEFYTDFGGSQRKKSRNSFGSPICRESRASPSPLPQPTFASPNPPGTTSFSTPGASFSGFNSTPNSNPNPNFTSPSNFSPSNHGPNNQAIRPASAMTPTPGHFNPCTNFNCNRNPYPRPRGNVYPSSTPLGGFSTPSSTRYSNPGSSAYAPRSATYNYNGAIYTNSTAPHPYNGGRGSYSAESPQRHVGGASPNHGQSHDSNRSWRSKQSPGSGSRGTPRRASGRGFQRSLSEVAAPASFAKRSMLEDPWIDLVPVRIESVAFRLDSCSGSSSHDWLPMSVSRVATPPTRQGVFVSISGPSLAESLAASFSDAVAGEEGA